MKKEFDRANAVKLGEMYAERAMVAMVVFKDTAPEDTARRFAAYLQAEKVPHEILMIDERSVSFATLRDPEVDTLGPESKTRKMVAGFFKGAFADAFNMEAYYQKDASNDDKMDQTATDFAKVKRSVHKRAA